MDTPATATDSVTSVPVDRQQRRRAAIAGLLGTFIEYYDFAMYGFLVVYLAPLFFPATNPATSVLASFGALAGGYVMRPLGALFFGTLGDRRGRRVALLVTIVGMGTSTAVMGLLPTYAVAGVAAPVLLIVIRLLQGFSAGGEIVGSATLVAETSGRRRRGLFQAVTTLGSNTGTAAAPAAVGAAVAIFGSANMASWGWRVPLLLSAVFTVLCLLYRLKLHESDEFQQLEKAGKVEKIPLLAALRDYWQTILGVAVMVLAMTCTAAVLMTYMNVYLINEVGMAKGTVYWLSAICLVLGGAGFLLGGLLVDRIGPGWTILIGFGGVGALIYPLLLVMGSTSNVVVIGVLYAVTLAVNNTASTGVYVIFTTSFPTRVRYSGAAFGFNLGAIVGGGITPYAAAQIIEATGAPRSPALIVIGAAVLGLLGTSYMSWRRRTVPAAAVLA
ncbi:MAG TPA: MFS transporter [Amycolatopsis sp.]|nr:MFS transporter [Amycolatopsis sp.]